MLKIKLSRIGKNKRPFYRIVVNERRSKRNGKYIDLLGHYNPLSQPKKIVIDMGGVSWLNSMGVGALMRSFTTVTNSDGKLKLARLTDKARGLFTMTQLIKVFEIHETVDQAVNSF